MDYGLRPVDYASEARCGLRCFASVDYAPAVLWITGLTALWISQHSLLAHISVCWGVLEKACRQRDTLLNNCGGGGDDKRGAEGHGVAYHFKEREGWPL